MIVIEDDKKYIKNAEKERNKKPQINKWIV